MTYKSLGYSVIGMTNMPEAKLAREAEICYATVAMVTDFDCWHPDHDAVTVQDIIRVLSSNADKAKGLVARLARIFPGSTSLSDRLGPRAGHRSDHRPGGARSGTPEEARRGGGTDFAGVIQLALAMNHPPSCPALCRASTSLRRSKKSKTWMAGTSPAMTEAGIRPMQRSRGAS